MAIGRPIAPKTALPSVKTALYRQNTADFVHVEGILYRKAGIAGAAEAVEEGAAAEGFA